MREYQKLCDELKKKLEELKSISSDPDRESEIKTEISLLEEEIVTFPIQGTKLSEEQAERLRKSVVGEIVKTAKNEYDKQMEEYMSMNFWGKAKTMFTGKKPKKDSSDIEIIDKYGEEYKNKCMQGEIARAKREYDALVEWLKNYYEKHPEDQEASLEDRLNEEKEKYEARVREKIERNNSYLEEAKEVVSEGKIKL